MKWLALGKAIEAIAEGVWCSGVVGQLLSNWSTHESMGNYYQWGWLWWRFWWTAYHLHLGLCDWLCPPWSPWPTALLSLFFYLFIAQHHRCNQNWHSQAQPPLLPTLLNLFPFLISYRMTRDLSISNKPPPHLPGFFTENDLLLYHMSLFIHSHLSLIISQLYLLSISLSLIIIHLYWHRKSNEIEE